jgi:NAD(P)-dependent dehydrogenase (short-subunit alcohol dehydrogenase family)
MPDNGYPLALVTGGAHRLGKVFSLALARRGYAILLHYHESKDDAKETGEEIRALGVPVHLKQADLSTPDGIQSIVESLDSIPNQIKVVVNSAGVMHRQDVRNVSLEDWDHVQNLNLRAPFFIAQQFARRMSDGLIINITDAGEGKNWTSYSTYLICKNGISAMTRILARALAPSIRVNAIAPGLVFPPDEFPAGEWEKLVNRSPIPQPVPGNDIASALEFLLDNTSITGQIITVDGGYSLV